MGKKPMTIAEAIKGYILDCRTRGRSGRTIEWYEQKLNYFSRWIFEESEVDKLIPICVPWYKFHLGSLTLLYLVRDLSL